MTVNYDFLEPKAVALTQDIYPAPNIVTAEWHERQLHFAAVLYAREQWATQTTLCVATRQLTIELTERGSWDTPIREVAIRAGKRRTFLGLHKDPGCRNPQRPDIAVLNRHTVMFSGWCQDPLSYLTVFHVFILAAGKTGEFQVIKAIGPD